MRKRSFVFLTLLAVGAFLASSPEALRRTRELFGNPSRCSDELATRDPVDVRQETAASHASGHREFRSSRSGALANLGTDFASRSAAGETNAEPPVTGDDTQNALDAVAAIPDKDLQQALENSLRNNGTNAADFRELLVRRWAEADPKAVAAWAGSVDDAALKASLLRQAVAVWADKDLSAALEWAKTIPEGPSREATILAIGYEGARTNSFEAFDLTASLPPSAGRDALLLHLARQWSANEPAEAIEWANSVSDPALREKLISAAAISAATQDPVGAASLIATNLAPGPSQDQAAVAIVQRWAQTDPEAAASWVNQFPEGSVKTAASEALASVQAGSTPLN
jgi:hypothetical protein